MAFKILKDSGFVPSEVELFHQRAELRAQLDAIYDDAEHASIVQNLSELAQKISLRLESLRAHGSL